MTSRLAVAALVLLVLVAGADALRQRGDGRPQEPAVVTPVGGSGVSVDLFDLADMPARRSPQPCDQMSSETTEWGEPASTQRCVRATLEFAPVVP